jgi:hypothetical protein
MGNIHRTSHSVLISNVFCSLGVFSGDKSVVEGGTGTINNMFLETSSDENIACQNDEGKAE